MQCRLQYANAPLALFDFVGAARIFAPGGFRIMERVEVEQVVEAPRDQVWSRYTDFVSWTNWAGMGKVSLAREGAPTPDGVGCIREINNFGFAVYEEVLRFEPHEYMTYHVVRGGIPIVNHFGEVYFNEIPGGTLVRWRCRFDSRIPGLGWAFRLLVQFVFRRALHGLRREMSTGKVAAA